MNFLHPGFLWALLALPAVIALYVWASRQRRESLAKIGRSDLLQPLLQSVSRSGRRWKTGLMIVVVGLLGLALAGPRYGSQVRQIQREGVDLVIALDVSSSMLAEDVAPSRLERAKREVTKLLGQLNGDRVGLVIFAGDAFVQCPLTTDYSALQMFLDVAGPSSLSAQGSNFTAALTTAQQTFRTPLSQERTGPKTRAVLLISDGENHAPGLSDAVAQLREQDIHLYTVGVGEEQGAPIPMMRNGRFVGYKEDQQGEVVKTSLEDATLREVAGDGSYFRIGRTFSSFGQFAAALDELDRSVLNEEAVIDYTERYQWPLAMALLLLFVEVFVRERRKPKKNESVAK